MFILFCDGGSRGNPGPSASGWAIFETANRSSPKTRDEASAIANNLNSKPILEGYKFLGNTTNNVAEWSGLIFGLENLINFHKTSSEIELLVLLDSELVCKQVKGIYKVKQPHLQVLDKQVKALVFGLKSFEIAHIFREDNKLADNLVNQCLDSQ
jgi:ribonuclease HI